RFRDVVHDLQDCAQWLRDGGTRRIRPRGTERGLRWPRGLRGHEGRPQKDREEARCRSLSGWIDTFAHVEVDLQFMSRHSPACLSIGVTAAGLEPIVLDCDGAFVWRVDFP